MSMPRPRRVLVTYDPRALSAREAVAAIGERIPPGSAILVLPTIDGLTPESWGQWARAEREQREHQQHPGGRS